MAIDIASIASVASALQSAGEIVKTIVGLRDGTMIQAKVIELNGIILSAQGAALTAQSDQFTLLKRVSELEKEVADMKAWDAEKEKYELKEVSPGAFAYVNKPGVDSSEPKHWLCTACYQHSRKSLLQNRGTAPAPSQRSDIFYCPECKAEMRISWNVSRRLHATAMADEPVHVRGDAP